jgi:hypothetical protein
MIGIALVVDELNVGPKLIFSYPSSLEASGASLK